MTKPCPQLPESKRDTLISFTHGFRQTKEKKRENKGKGQNIRGPPRGLLRPLSSPGNGLRLSLGLHPTGVVWVGRVVVGREFDRMSCSALSDAEPHLWRSNRFPLVLPPCWGGWLTGRAMGLPVSLLSWLVCVRPRTSLLLLFLGLLAQAVTLSFVGSLLPHCELCRLVAVVIVVDIVVHLLFTECWERSLSKETRNILGPTPLVSSYSPEGTGVVVHPPGRRSGPTLSQLEAKVSGVGSL